MAVALAAVCGIAVWLGVALLRARRLHRRALEERGWLLERERQGAARSAVRGERDRIARELHDIVSHNVSLMVVQAGAARDVLSTMPDEAEAAIRAVEGAGRATMTELRHLLGLLAPSQSGDDAAYGEEDGPGGEGPDGEAAGGRAGGRADGADGAGDWYAGLAPQPGLGALSSLVDRIAFAGLPVEVRVSGQPRPLPDGIDVTAYRIVQEALTNALKHGDGGQAEVTVRYADRSLRVEVLNTGPSVLTGAAPPPAPRPGPRRRARGEGTGRGLLGLRERVAVYGGELDARRRLGGGYRVRARIPLDRP
ncbi:sensor histidine kinase [Streptomyces sp. NPDC008313]|uniref:sensor histidine kinase n=1 Tax=Streptomyces sp. NPDC008313 TaxID=3364826 RepID=UPI0036E488DC